MELHLGLHAPSTTSYLPPGLILSLQHHLLLLLDLGISNSDAFRVQHHLVHVLDCILLLLRGEAWGVD